MKKIFPLTIDGAWWRGTLSVRYNFRMVAKIIGLLLLLASIGFGLYWLGIGGGFWLFRSCSNTEKAYDNAIISKAQYSDAFDWVATTRAYLDGDSQG